jgi:hypothetical protein
MKPGDLVKLRFIVIPVNEPEGRYGLIIKEVLHYDRPYFQVLWSNEKLLIEDSIDLEVIDETR